MWDRALDVDGGYHAAQGVRVVVAAREQTVWLEAARCTVVGNLTGQPALLRKGVRFVQANDVIGGQRKESQFHCGIVGLVCLRAMLHALLVVVPMVLLGVGGEELHGF